MIRRTITVFIFAFLLNLIWEHLHSVLYVSYQGGAITDFILFKAALFDAVVITFFTCIFLLVPPFLKEGGRVIETEDLNPSTSKTRVLPLRKGESRLRLFLLFLALLIFSILLEKWALATGRWLYADAMPIIPLLNVGLTPAVQLGLLGCISYRSSDFFKN